MFVFQVPELAILDLNLSATGVGQAGLLSWKSPQAPIRNSILLLVNQTDPYPSTHLLHPGPKWGGGKHHGNVDIELHVELWKSHIVSRWFHTCRDTTPLLIN